MDAIVGAGGVAKEGDPLLGLVGYGQPKALLPIADKPMVQWVLDAVAGSRQVENVIVVGLDDVQGLKAGDKPLHNVPDAGSLLDNLAAGAKRLAALKPSAKRAVWISADIPLVTTEMIDWVIGHVMASDHDLYYTIIAKSVMEARFPESKRTYTRLKGSVVCGGDVNGFAVSLITGVNPVWQQIVEARKSVFKQASLVGLWPLLLLVSGQMTKGRAVRLVRERLGIEGRFLECPYAELGMDVDKPFQYEIVARELAQFGQPK